jgi:putative DNA primase/helicase
MSTLEKRQRAAVRYLERGLAVITVAAGEKKPGRSDWQNLRLSPEAVPRHLNDGQNIGLLIGEPSDWRMDVDLDTDEAVKIANQFLPPTLTSGRESRPLSHWWLRSPGAESRDWRDTSGAKLVELRASGRQTIVAPSTHPEGDKDNQGERQ